MISLRKFIADPIQSFERYKREREGRISELERENEKLRERLSKLQSKNDKQAARTKMVDRDVRTLWYHFTGQKLGKGQERDVCERIRAGNIGRPKPKAPPPPPTRTVRDGP